MSAPNEYTAKVDKTQELSPQQKLEGLEEILRAVKTSLLTSRDPNNGQLHARAMAPASHEKLKFAFIANKDSGKLDELQHDPNVNISYYNHDTTDWASIAGKAKITQDQERIAQLWNPGLKAWFGDISKETGDETKTGDRTDPRVIVIEVVPESIRYWKAKTGKLGQLADVVKGAVTGNVAAPGNLVEITNGEIQLVHGLGSKA